MHSELCWGLSDSNTHVGVYPQPQRVYRYIHVFFFGCPLQDSGERGFFSAIRHRGAACATEGEGLAWSSPNRQCRGFDELETMHTSLPKKSVPSGVGENKVEKGI